MVKKRTRDETRRAVLETAEILFRRTGFDAVSITEIAQNCLMTSTNVYHVFRNKADIAEALLARSLDSLVAEFDVQQADIPQAPNSVVNFVTTILRHFDPGPDPFLFDLWRRAASENWGIWESLLQEARDRISIALKAQMGEEVSSLMSDAVFRASIAFFHPALVAEEHRPTLEEEAVALFSQLGNMRVFPADA